MSGRLTTNVPLRPRTRREIISEALFLIAALLFTGGFFAAVLASILKSL